MVTPMIMYRSLQGDHPAVGYSLIPSFHTSTELTVRYHFDRRPNAFAPVVYES